MAAMMKEVGSDEEEDEEDEESDEEKKSDSEEEETETETEQDTESETESESEPEVSHTYTCVSDYAYTRIFTEQYLQSEYIQYLQTLNSEALTST